ncbi:unnamed protein product, partial [Polarella glacialis]
THYTACVMMDVIACMGVSSAYKDRNFLRYHVLNETLLIIRISQASIVGCFPLQLGLNLACSTFNAVLSKQLASDSDTYAASPTVSSLWYGDLMIEIAVLLGAMMVCTVV